MSKIISIATGVPAHKHKQEDILGFMTTAYGQSQVENRKLRFLYKHSGISSRYSVIPDFSNTMSEWKFFPSNQRLEPVPPVEKRMQWYGENAAVLCISTIAKCIEGKIQTAEITHLITVSCTGMSAPGLDLEIIEAMGLPSTTYRTSVNFMGCYAAVHALKLAHGILAHSPTANVVIVCVELCTLHFQNTYTTDNITAGLLFGDGCAAVLLKNDNAAEKGIIIRDFYSDVIQKGKRDMAWEISSTGFLMTLTNYISDLVEEDFKSLVEKAMANFNLNRKAISQWCIHPGGRKILEAIEKSLCLEKAELKKSYEVLNDFGNMSSPTVLFVLKKYLDEMNGTKKDDVLFTAAFGPGLTMETFIAVYD